MELYRVFRDPVSVICSPAFSIISFGRKWNSEMSYGKPRRRKERGQGKGPSKPSHPTLWNWRRGFIGGKGFTYAWKRPKVHIQSRDKRKTYVGLRVWPVTVTITVILTVYVKSETRVVTKLNCQRYTVKYADEISKKLKTCLPFGLVPWRYPCLFHRARFQDGSSSQDGRQMGGYEVKRDDPRRKCINRDPLKNSTEFHSLLDLNHTEVNKFLGTVRQKSVQFEQKPFSKERPSPQHATEQ